MTTQTMRIVLLIAMAAAVSACASSKAQILDDRPALVVPPVPPREIEPPLTVEAPPVEPLPEVAPPPAATTKPARSNRPAEPKPDPKPDPPETPAPLPTPAPVAGLRTPTTPSGPEATRQIREMLDRASAVLNKMDVRNLSEDRQANYRAAKSFIEQGWDALKKDDLALSRSFARRAEDIARQLESGR